jgi:nitroimidazol reductase NimA-like FMN-containing flavoprotein (pyridoxamine 5'-phosphate oxidase superfamily)
MRPMRRKDREMPRDFAEAVIDKKCRFAVMATVNPDGTPYCVPLSVVRDGEWLYFHCAREGHKIDNLTHRNRVCVSCVGDTSLPPDYFTVAYESATVFGTAEEVTEREERIRALRLICERYTPANMRPLTRRSAGPLMRPPCGRYTSTRSAGSRGFIPDSQRRGAGRQMREEPAFWRGSVRAKRR